MSTITVTGNVVEDQVRLNWTSDQTAAANFTVAENTRYRDDETGDWKSGEATYWNVEVFGVMADRVAEQLVKGQRVVVVGKTRTRQYKDQEGNRRRELRINASDVALSLKFGPKEQDND